MDRRNVDSPPRFGDSSLVQRMASDLAGVPQQFVEVMRGNEHRWQTHRARRLDPMVESIFEDRQRYSAMERDRQLILDETESRALREGARQLDEDRAQSRAESHFLRQAVSLDAVARAATSPQEALRLDTLSRDLRSQVVARRQARIDHSRSQWEAEHRFIENGYAGLRRLSDHGKLVVNTGLEQVDKMTAIITKEIGKHCELLATQISVITTYHEKIIAMVNSVHSVEIEARKVEHRHKIDCLRQAAEELLANKRHDLDEWKSRAEDERSRLEHRDSFSLQKLRQELDEKRQRDEHHLRMLDEAARPRGLLSWIFS